MVQVHDASRGGADAAAETASVVADAAATLAGGVAKEIAEAGSQLPDADPKNLPEPTVTEPEPEGADGEEVQGEDYDEDEAAAKLAGEEPAEGTAPVAGAEPKAVAEDRIKALETRIEELTKTRTAADPAPSKPEPVSSGPPTHTEVIKRLIELQESRDPKVLEAHSHVNEYKQWKESFAVQHNEVAKSLQVITSQILEKQNIIKFLTDEQKANPDAFMQQERLAGLKAEVSELRQDKFDKEAETRELAQKYHEYEAAEKVWDKELGRLGEESLTSERSALAENSTQKAEYDKAMAAYTETLPMAMEALGVPKDKQRRFARLVIAEAKAVADRGYIKDVKEFIIKEAANLADDWGLTKAAKAVTYGQQKKADAGQAAPKGAAAVATKPPAREKFGSKEADRLAGKDMRSFFSGARP